jgi:threonine dehydrogenase-like Zn-dependent dehydrogenase
MLGGVGAIRHETVPGPKIEDGRDAIVRVSSCAICGSGLHLYDGLMPGMKHGGIMGHEFMGEVVEVDRDNKKLKVGDRVVVPFTIIWRRMRSLQTRQFPGLRTLKPRERPRRQGIRPHHGWALRPKSLGYKSGARASWRCATSLSY